MFALFNMEYEAIYSTICMYIGLNVLQTISDSGYIVFLQCRKFC